MYQEHAFLFRLELRLDKLQNGDGVVTGVSLQNQEKTKNKYRSEGQGTFCVDVRIDADDCCENPLSLIGHCLECRRAGGQAGS